MIVKLGNKLVAPGQPVYVIAEIGSNHNNDLREAITLIRAAAAAGADAAKFQLYRADQLYPGTTTPYAVPDSWLPVLQEECRRDGVEFLCSVFNPDTLYTYLELEPAAIKIASPEATNLGFLNDCALSGLPLLISTGAMNGIDVDRIIHAMDGVELALLHCVSAYPAPPQQMNLRVIPQMHARYHVPIGLSDHTEHASFAPVVATSLGACLIEKHLTLDRRNIGPDHHFALEPDAFKVMVAEIRETEMLLGSDEKHVQACEDPTDRRAA